MEFDDLGFLGFLKEAIVPAMYHAPRGVAGGAPQEVRPSFDAALKFLRRLRLGCEPMVDVVPMNDISNPVGLDEPIRVGKRLGHEPEMKWRRRTRNSGWGAGGVLWVQESGHGFGSTVSVPGWKKWTGCPHRAPAN
jgi:hypothetical protein